MRCPLKENHRQMDHEPVPIFGGREWAKLLDLDFCIIWHSGGGGWCLQLWTKNLGRWASSTAEGWQFGGLHESHRVSGFLGGKCWSGQFFLVVAIIARVACAPGRPGWDPVWCLDIGGTSGGLAKKDLVLGGLVGFRGTGDKVDQV
jgi:hypothetical protein